jgi:hypothetical protein
MTDTLSLSLGPVRDGRRSVPIRTSHSVSRRGVVSPLDHRPFPAPLRPPRGSWKHLKDSSSSYASSSHSIAPTASSSYEDNVRVRQSRRGPVAEVHRVRKENHPRPRTGTRPRPEIRDVRNFDKNVDSPRHQNRRDTAAHRAGDGFHRHAHRREYGVDVPLTGQRVMRHWLAHNLDASLLNKL